MFTYELARRLQNKGVTINAMNPGMVATNIGMDEGGIFAASKKIMDRIMGKTPEQGADTIVFLASSPEVESVTGKCFENRKPVLTSTVSCDEAAQARLWRISEKLCGLTAE